MAAVFHLHQPLELKAALSARGLVFRYRGGFQLGPLDLELPRGQVTALIGPNGAGKTTLLRLLAGLFVPAEGSLLLGGEPVRDRLQLLREVAWVAADPGFPKQALTLAPWQKAVR